MSDCHWSHPAFGCSWQLQCSMGQCCTFDCLIMYCELVLCFVFGCQWTESVVTSIGQCCALTLWYCIVGQCCALTLILYCGSVLCFDSDSDTVLWVSALLWLSDTVLWVSELCFEFGCEYHCQLTQSVVWLSQSVFCFDSLSDYSQCLKMYQVLPVPL